jgi:competence protein ComEC
MKTLKYLIGIVLVIVIAVSLTLQFFPSKTSAPPTTVEFQVTVLDVGQADSTVIQSGNSLMLIDAGSNNSADNLVKTLKNLGVTKLDVVIGTHPHEDHIGGLDNVINQFDIGQVYLPDITSNTQTFEDVLEALENKKLNITDPIPGTAFNLGSATCTILAPNSLSYGEINDYSIVIRIKYGNISFLLAGDAATTSENEILAKSFTLKSDVLKVGHHGSSTSTSEKYLSSISPRYAVISVGQGNDYGHPHKETLDKLTTAGIKVYRTDLDGTVTFTSDGNNLAIKTGK